MRMYEVLKTFRNYDGAVLIAGNDLVECDDNRAAKLRANGIIGCALTEKAVEPAAPVAVAVEPEETATEPVREVRRVKRGR